MKLYVIVDEKLSRSQQAVQASHAVAEYLLLHRDTDWKNGTLVLLKDNVEKWQHLAHAVFREPDLDNAITAIAALGVDEHVRHLKLL